MQKQHQLVKYRYEYLFDSHVTDVNLISLFIPKLTSDLSAKFEIHFDA